ncbi:hypothetical protein [Aquimarina agarilytica]|uniref:hypothetical protein n=1 Tax=Aquimarina agarilytica TaxID=1087449 RepID=UPI000288F860|nr:hypothetical protein [Aquimarina agarilytica]
MKKLLKYTLTFLCVIGGYLNINAQYNESGGGFISIPTTRPNGPVNKPKADEEKGNFKVVFKPSLKVYHNKARLPDFPSDNVGYNSSTCELPPCNDGPNNPFIPPRGFPGGPIPADPNRPSDREFDNPFNQPSNDPFNPNYDPNYNPQEISSKDLLEAWEDLFPKDWSFNNVFKKNIQRLRSEGNERITDWMNINSPTFNKKKYESFGEAFSDFSLFRSGLILAQLERDAIYKCTQNIDKFREDFFKASDRMSVINKNSTEYKNLIKRKNSLYLNILNEYKAIDGINKGYNKAEWLSRLAKEQGDHFFRKSSKKIINSTDDNAKATLYRIKDATAVGPRDYFFNSTTDKRDDIANDAKKFSDIITETDNVDYGLLKLETDQRGNTDLRSWLDNNKKAVVDYFEINNNSKGASHCMRYLFKTWSNKEDFVTPTEFYKSVSKAGFQTSSKPNLALSAKPSQQAIDIGYLGFSNVLHAFFDGRNDAFANQFKGYIINDMFKVNGLPSSIQFEFLGATFDFGITNGRTNDVVFVGDNGRTLLNNGFNTTEVIKEIGKGNDFGSLSTSDDKFTKFALEELKSGSEVDFPNQIIIEKSIIEERPDILCVYNKLKTTNGGLFRRTFNIFSKSGEYNLVLRMKHNNRAAVAVTDAKSIDENGSVFINFDPLRSSGISNIEIAATILHEGIHAELFRLVHANEPNVKIEERERILELAYIYRNSNDLKHESQHIHMTEIYVKPIAQALRNLQGNRFSVDHYMHLAWEGLLPYSSSKIRPSKEQLTEWAEKRSIIENSKNDLKCD